VLVFYLIVSEVIITESTYHQLFLVQPPYDSTSTDTYPSHSQVSPHASKASGLPCAGLGEKRASIPGRSDLRAEKDAQRIRNI
jgi:hypothetical protein